MTTTSPDHLNAILDAAAAAAPVWAATAPSRRAAALVAVADALDDSASTLIPCALRETGLAEARLTAELRRTTVQLRLFAEVVTDGTYLDVRIDDADPGFVLGPRPDLRRMLEPVGVALNFAASNFPFAFSVAGGDSAAALAAGCALVVKAHPGHPELSRATAAVVTEALSGAGAPDGLVALIEGQDAGTSALRDERVDIATFTGSTHVGRQLADIAAGRPRPIPFFGELGSTNPVVVTSAAFAERAADIAGEYVASVAGSAGQLCTKPGFLWAPAASTGADTSAFREAVADTAAGVPEHRLLTHGIGQRYIDRRDAVIRSADVEIIAAGSVRTDESGYVHATPTVVAVPAERLAAADADILDESFGPLSVIVDYSDETRVPDLVGTLHRGSLTGTIHAARDESSPTLTELVRVFSRTTGRVILDGWPTGVAVTHAQQHGGPYPATTNDSSTSVGTAAIRRFLRGVAYQNTPQRLLPPAVQDDNPWGVPQRRHPAGESVTWGR